MTFEEDRDLLDEYNRWASAKRVAGVDTTPAAFLVERAQASAFDKIVDLVSYLSTTGPVEDAEAWEKVKRALLEILEN